MSDHATQLALAELPPADQRDEADDVDDVDRFGNLEEAATARSKEDWREESDSNIMSDEDDSQMYEYDNSEDRRPAPLAPVGWTLAWSMPSLLNSDSIAAVVSTPSIVTLAENSDDLVLEDPIYADWLKWEQRPILPILQVDPPARHDMVASASSSSTSTGGGGSTNSDADGVLHNTTIALDSSLATNLGHPATLPYRHDAGSTVRPIPGQTLRLDVLLSHEFDIPSQVWLATVLPTAHQVIVKLLTDQANKSDPHQYLPPQVYERADFSRASMGRNAQMAMCREADCFKALSALQGRSVPISYGFYTFQLPQGILVVGHVMEYIQSIDMFVYFEQVVKPDPQLVDLFFSSLLRTYIELHRNNIAQQDTALRNILLLPSEGTAYRFALVDFTTACSISYAESQNESWHVPESSILQISLEEELDGDTFWGWMKTDHAKLLWKMFSSNAVQLAALEAELGVSDQPEKDCSNPM